MLSAFPQFSRLHISDKAEVEKITKNFPPYSDYNFVSLFTWDIQDQILICTLNGNLVVKFTDYITNKPFLSFLGVNNTDETIRKLLEYSEQNGMGDELKLIPQSVIESIGQPEYFKIGEDRDGFDYILAVGDFIDHSGQPHARRRNLIRKFEKEHGPRSKIATLDLADEQTKEAILQVFEAWEKSRNASRKDTANELDAITKLLNNAHQLDLIGIGLYIDEALKAFVINEYTDNEHAIGHFEKADTAYKGIFQFLNHHAVVHMHTHGKNLLNYEQDLGIEGLRKSKMAHNPSHFLKKYTVALAE